MERILGGLNEEQKQAVTATEGFVRIVAGAGSGKTKALTHRYAYLVRAAGIHPGNVLCVTFTNKAAGEMKRRVRALIGDGNDTSLITTYHGFCVRVLREDIGRLFYPENFLIIDNSDRKKIIEEIYGELDLKLDYASFEKIISLIDKKKSDTSYVDIMLSRSDNDDFTEDNLNDEIIRRFLLRQKKNFALDFNDLVNFVFVLFERYPDVKLKWQQRLHYIMVDEFQDSSRREMKLIDMLSEVHKNLFVVGDPDQNIYEWRGAKVEILVDFDKTYPNTKTIIMDKNYRSTPQILKVANSVIDKNKNRIKKSLRPMRVEGDSVIHLHAKSEHEEAAMIVGQIRYLVSNGYKFGDIAILYRAGFLSQFVESAFNYEKIPYELPGSVRFLERMEIADALAYLKIIDHDDDEALMRIINLPRRGFGKSRVMMLKSIAQNEGISMYRALKKYADIPEFSRSRIYEFINMVEKIRSIVDKTAVSEILNRVLVDSGYEKYIREAGNMERLDNISELKKMTLDQERSNEKISIYDEAPPEFLSLSEFLSRIAMMSVNGVDKEDNPDKVKLMTIHASKGLEFPVCFVVGMTDGIFPSGRSLEERKEAGLEEERRLCFVAVTRAMKRLYLTDSEGAGQNNDGKSKTPSRFLVEMGEENYIRIGEISKSASDDMMKLAQKDDYSAPKKLEVGSKVGHIIFGEGVISDIVPERGVYMVKFGENVKPISMDYDFDLWNRLKNVENEPEKQESAELKSESDEITQPCIEENNRELLEETESEQIPDLQNDIQLKIELPQTDTESNNNEQTEEFVVSESEINESEKISVSEPQEKSEVEKVSVTKSQKNSKPKKNPRPDTSEYDNLWKRDDVPHSGWECTGISDLGEPVGVCGMCGYQIIRYVHHMRHPNYPYSIGAGCICAGKMEGDIERAKLRENEFKSRLAKRNTFIHRKRLLSQNGNEYFKVSNDEIVTILKDKFNPNKYKAVFKNMYTKSYDTPEEALGEIFDNIISKNK